MAKSLTRKVKVGFSFALGSQPFIQSQNDRSTATPRAKIGLPWQKRISGQKSEKFGQKKTPTTSSKPRSSRDRATFAKGKSTIFPND